MITAENIDCPGIGKCHGCAKWCVVCDDVSATCGATPDERSCDEHQCRSCRHLLTEDEQDASYERDEWPEKYCAHCYQAMVREAAVLSFEINNAINVHAKDGAK